MKVFLEPNDLTNLGKIQLISSSMCDKDEALLIVSHETFYKIVNMKNEKPVTQDDADQWGYGGKDQEAW